MFMDSKFSRATVQEVLPNAKVMYCTWHWLELEFPARFGKLPEYSRMRSAVYELKDIRTQEQFEVRWASFKVDFPDMSILSYMQRWYDKRESWVHAWTYQCRTLGCHTSSPAESSNSSFKAWMSESDADLVSLLYTR
jgi:hypothetical protein